VTRAAYTGHEALTFSDYTDLETGKTLHAEPGRSYDVAPASGRVVPEMPEPWFVATEPKALEAAPDLSSAAAEDDPEAVPDATPAPDDEQHDE
jgi:hypothetical protein